MIEPHASLETNTHSWLFSDMKEKEEEYNGSGRNLNCQMILQLLDFSS